MILLNGENKDRIEITDRGLQYGDGLFETILVKLGRPVFLDQHLDRLYAGCHRLQITPPSKDLMAAEISHLCNLWISAHNSEDLAVLKIIITRGSGGRGYRLPDTDAATRILSMHTYPDYPAGFAEQGVVMRVCDLRLGHNTALAGIKHLNRLEQVMARAEWNDASVQEGLLLDTEGHVIEGTMTNVFFVKNDCIYTPQLMKCGVAGVMRGVILTLCTEQNYSFVEQEFFIDDLLCAEEIFICNSVIGIWPVKQLGATELTAGRWTHSLQSLLNHRINEDVAGSCLTVNTKKKFLNALSFTRFIQSFRSKIVVRLFVAMIWVMLGVIAGWLGAEYNHALTQPMLVDRTVHLEIEKGDSLNRIIDKLSAEQLLFKPFWFKVIAFQQGTYRKLKTGEYELTTGITIPQILRLFASGKAKQHSITFLEGWNFREILHEIEKHPDIEHTFVGMDAEKILAKYGFGSGPMKSPEGLFFPDTYFFEKHASDVSLLERAYDRMQQVLQQEWLNRAEGLPLKTPYEALTLASIIEKETGNASERPMIAGVFVRRLQQNMLLQTDPTVIYGMGENYHGNIRLTDLQTMTPYNTYVISGLPPTPIAMPGRASINAALHPMAGDSLYFVARGDGTHEFSSTLKEHNLAVDTFQRNKRHE